MLHFSIRPTGVKSLVRRHGGEGSTQLCWQGVSGAGGDWGASREVYLARAPASPPTPVWLSWGNARDGHHHLWLHLAWQVETRHHFLLHAFARGAPVSGSCTRPFLDIGSFTPLGSRKSSQLDGLSSPVRPT